MILQTPLLISKFVLVGQLSDEHIHIAEQEEGKSSGTDCFLHGETGGRSALLVTIEQTRMGDDFRWLGAFVHGRWSRPIRPTLAAEVWKGSDARRAGAQSGKHAMGRTKQ